MSKHRNGRDGHFGNGGRGNEIASVAQSLWDKARNGNTKPRETCTIRCRDLQPFQRTTLRDSAAEVIEAVNKIAKKHNFVAHLKDGDVKLVLQTAKTAAVK